MPGLRSPNGKTNNAENQDLTRRPELPKVPLQHRQGSSAIPIISDALLPGTETLILAFIGAPLGFAAPQLAASNTDTNEPVDERGSRRVTRINGCYGC